MTSDGHSTALKRSLRLCLNPCTTLPLPIVATIGNGNVVHGLRHSLRDRLRAVECPSDVIDAIGGWTTGRIGHAYGNGYSVKILAKWMKKIEC